MDELEAKWDLKILQLSAFVILLHKWTDSAGNVTLLVKEVQRNILATILAKSSHKRFSAVA